MPFAHCVIIRAVHAIEVLAPFALLASGILVVAVVLRTLATTSTLCNFIASLAIFFSTKGLLEGRYRIGITIFAPSSFFSHLVSWADRIYTRNLIGSSYLKIRTIFTITSLIDELVDFGTFPWNTLGVVTWVLVLVSQTLLAVAILGYFMSFRTNFDFTLSHFDGIIWNLVITTEYAFLGIYISTLSLSAIEFNAFSRVRFTLNLS